MGFLKFLKREKKDDLQDLDLPPAPPPLEDSQDFNADFAFDEKSQDIPDFPEIPDVKAPDETKFDLPELDEQEKEDFPELPDLEEPAPIPPIKAPTAIPAPEPMPSPVQPPMQMHQPEVAKEPVQVAKPRRLFSHGRKHIERKEVYLRVDKFRAVLGNINTIRSDLRKSEELLMKLENLKNAKDRSFDKVKSSLGDLQKKLIFADRTLFKGE